MMEVKTDDQEEVRLARGRSGGRDWGGAENDGLRVAEGRGYELGWRRIGSSSLLRIEDARRDGIR
jgi:hypothetical protein